jgi:hypothetical protein
MARASLDRSPLDQGEGSRNACGRAAAGQSGCDVAARLLGTSGRRRSGRLLVVIWLLLFGVSHFDAPPNPGIPTANFDHFYPVGRFQPDLANEWNLAALQAAVGVLVLLGLGVGRRLRRRMPT